MRILLPLAEFAVYSDTAGTADEGVVDLAVGQNEIKVRVVSADRTSTGTYTVVVTRQDQ